MAKKRIKTQSNPVLDLLVGSAQVSNSRWSQLKGAHPHFLYRLEASVDIKTHDEGWFRHHNFYALYIVRSGRGNHIINGHSYKLARGDVYIMPPGAIHACTEVEDLNIDAFYFRAAVLQREEMAVVRTLPDLNALFLGDLRANNDAPQDGYRLCLKTEEFEAAVAIIDKIRAEMHTDQAGILIARQLFFQLMVQVARWNSKALPAVDPASKDDKNKNKHSASIVMTLRFCEEHFREPLSVEHLAARAFVSHSHFHALFKAEIGLSPAAYIRHLRLAYAQKLLSGTTLPAYEIAQQCGFSDTTQFSRAFRTEFRQTPSGYRLSSKKRVIRKQPNTKKPPKKTPPPLR